jgi:hypothetical protein
MSDRDRHGTVERGEFGQRLADRIEREEEERRGVISQGAAHGPAPEAEDRRRMAEVLDTQPGPRPLIRHLAYGPIQRTAP